MQERIEPPILISRLMTFVMATSLVVLGVLVFTLDKMFPLNRPQVFFLNTQNLEDKELILTKISDEISDDDIELYKQQFVQEYVRERNEIVPDLAIMRAKWANDDNGVVKSRSTDAVFGSFAETDMVNVVLRELDEPFKVHCTVDFRDNFPVVQQKNTPDTYVVVFRYTCEYGQSDDPQYVKQEQLYSLRLKLQPTNEGAIKWAERMQNPLGLRVSGYEVIKGSNGSNDPLNWISNMEE